MGNGTNMKVAARGELGRLIWTRLDALGWTQQDLCFVLGVKPAIVSMVVLGRKWLSTPNAKEFGAALSISPAALLDAQNVDKLVAFEAMLVRRNGKDAVSQKMAAISARAAQVAARRSGAAA